jgi:hypothetical protein
VEALKMRNVILVLGMHRSGTSAAAGLFVKLGGAQPKTLMPAEGGNERGYFESQALMAFHDELLASAGSDWTDWRQFNPAWYQSPTATAFQKRAKQLLKEEFDGEPLVVLKDPRVCRFAPFWLEVLAGIKARAAVVIPVRAPLEVAFSMQKRFGFSLATGALLWLRHIIDAEFASRALPRSIFTWDQLLRDWRSVAEKASTELDLRWPRLSDAPAREIENFIGYDLVHHRVSAPELAAHPDIHEWTMSGYRAMLKLARAPRSSSALKKLDKARNAFNRASRMFGRTVLEDEIRSQDLRRQHDAARAELAGALQAKEQISLELNARAREASALGQALAEQGCQREQAELALAREKSLNVQFANDLEGRTAEMDNRRHGRTISSVETELPVTKKTRRAFGAECDFVTLPPTSRDTLIIGEPEMLENKFEGRFPSHQNAIDIFRNHWASNIEEVYPGVTSGSGPFFSADRRPSIAAQYLGFEPGSLQGMNILELGPLEGAHTYQLAKLGADRILAIEANAEAFLKCLIVKEILQTPRCRLLFGDCLKFLQESRAQFDMIFCSGILYHMENPFELIKAISRHTGRVFLWTHYYDPDIPLEPAPSPKTMVCDGLELTFYEQAYGDPDYGKFWGGNTSTASWLSRNSIEQCFRHFGYELTVHEDNRATQVGPHIIATALRQADGV